MEHCKQTKLRKLAVALTVLAVVFITELSGLPGRMGRDGAGMGSISSPFALRARAAAPDASKATQIYLFQDHGTENTPFHAVNLFPGDELVRYFCVKVEHTQPVTVNFHADLRDNSEILSDGLHLRLDLISTDEMLYEGSLTNQPVALDHKLFLEEEQELYYKVTIYLPTSAGTEFQNRELITDLRWWVDEPELQYLAPPKTGDTTQVTLLCTVSAASLVSAVWLLLLKRKKEEGAGHAKN